MNEADNAQLAETTGPSPGARLAEARQAQNMTPADVARQLKLSVWQVEALEGGRYHQLPGPIFVRGFIRNYARLLKIDPNEVLQAATDSLPQTPPHAVTQPSAEIPYPGQSRPRWPVLAAVAVAVVGALAIYEFYWNDAGTPAGGLPDAVAPSAGPAAPGMAQAPASPARTVKSTDTDVRAPDLAAVTIGPSTEADAPGTGSVETAAGNGKAPMRGERQVRLAFDQESWVEIRDRNERVIFSQLNRPGTQQFVNGLPPFSVVVGNAHGVRMSYDDKPVDLAQHTKVDVARLILQ